MRIEVTPTLSARLRAIPAGFAATLLSTVLLTSILAPFHRNVGLLNEGLIFLLLTLLISALWGWQVGLFAAVTTNLALNFFFVEPLHEFSVQDPSNVVGLAVFLVVSVVGGSLLSSSRRAAEEAGRRAAETQVLLRLSRAMIGQTDPNDALTSLCREVVDVFGSPGAAVLAGSGANWRVLASAGSDRAARLPDTGERALAERAVEFGDVIRLGHTGLSRSRRARIVWPVGLRGSADNREAVAFVPLRMGGRTLGVLRLDGPIGNTPFRDHPERLLAAFASEAALGLQRAELAQAASHADALMQADEMKSALMASISHDLKTPLAGIKTSVSSLLDRAVSWSDEDRQAFLETIDSQADRLDRVISDILDLNRIEAGEIAPALHALDVHDLFEDVRERTAFATHDRTLTVQTPGGAFIEVPAGSGRLTQVAIPLRSPAIEAPGRSAPLEVGEHTAEVLAECGIEPDPVYGAAAPRL